MSFLYRIRAIFTITLKRLWAQRSLTLATTLGLITAVALIMTVPIYADAVYYRILEDELSISAEQSKKPPFAYLYDYVGSWAGPVDWEDIQPVDDYLSHSAGRALGLPQKLLVRHFESNRFRIFPTDAADYVQQDQSLGTLRFASTSGLVDHIDILEGGFPSPADPSAASPMEVLVTQVLAAEMGLQVGDSFIAYHPDDNASQREFPIQIAGVWQARDAEDEFWFLAPAAFDNLMLVPEQSFSGQLGPALENEVDRAVWYLVMDGRRIQTKDVDGLVGRAQQVQRQADTLLPKISNRIAPTEGLQKYRQSVGQLTVLLSAFNAPVVGLILAFIGLVVGLTVNQRRNELAVMRSRGGAPFQIVGFAMLEGVVLGVVALAMGTAGALLLTQLMGRVQSFLDFSNSNALRVSLPANALQAGAVAIALAVLAQVLPTVAAAGDTIVTYKQQQARDLKRPWWQRVWLDLLLFIPAAYGFYLLRQQGSIFASAGEGAANTDPLQNPLLFLIPVLAVFSLTLFITRLLPWLMEAISWLLFQTNSVGVLMAARQLARTPRFYAMPLILLVLTMSLAVFTASLARTMDLQLYDEALYQVGADVSLHGAGVMFSMPGDRVSAESKQKAESGRAIYLPLSEYKEFPGVEAAARVGEFRSETRVGGERVLGTFIGVDRSDFGQVAFWRWDFARYRLGSLMNALASSPDAILVSRTFAQQNGLRPGDFFRLNVRLIEGSVELNTQIVGLLDYFPTWYPEQDGPLFVGNLETLFAQVGGELPYEVWLRTDGTPDSEGLQTALEERKLFWWRWDQPYSFIKDEQARPERQGVFGLLSIGFAAAALLTVLGFFMYALFSFRRRLVALGILRAVGLSARQMTIFVAFELAFLILSGLTLGTALGTAVSQLFIPYLQFGASEVELAPPYLVEIAWPAITQVYILFALLFVAALLVLGILLRRMKIFQAIKLGETT